MRKPTRPPAPSIDRSRPPVELRENANGETAVVVLGVEWPLTPSQCKVIDALAKAYPRRVAIQTLQVQCGRGSATRLSELVKKPDTPWSRVIIRPQKGGPRGYRLAWPATQSRFYRAS